jgi:two-component system, chemotaxis family, sensor kinase CheA
MATDVMEQMRVAFRAEALDLLIELDSALLALEGQPLDSSLVHRVFRAIHTIKGSGATAGYAHLASFAHKVEEAFDLARSGRLAVTPELIDCGLKACDVARLIIEGGVETIVVPGEAEVTAAFMRLLPVTEEAAVELEEEKQPAAEVRRAFEIVFKPHREMFYSGADPVTLLDDLRELGAAHITAHAEQVPALPSIAAEQCYLWWEILLVTDRDENALKDVFIFVEDDCDLNIKLWEDQAATVALLGAIPAEAFELFVLESEDHLAAIEREALILEQAPESRDNLDALFRAVHSIKGNTALLLGQVQSAALADTHPLHLLLRVVHGLESLLDPLRGPAAGPLSKEPIQTALETCDAVRGLLRSLTRNDAEGLPSPQLLERLGVRADLAPIGPEADGREAAFLNTTTQCVEMIAGCLKRIEEDREPAGPVLATYLRGLATLSAAAQYRKSNELEEPLAQQTQILETALSASAVLSLKQRSVLGRAFADTRAILERLTTRAAIGTPAPLAASLSTSAPRPQPEPPASPSTIRIDRDKLDRLMRVVGELLVARGAFPLLVQKLNNGISGTAVAKDLKDAGANISRIADELQTSVMSIRMLPVKTVLQRFPRLVRDLARSLKKEVRLVIEGEEIELDKTILEQIGDPLVHVIRNSVDHGLETPEQRRAKGKDEIGQLILRASRDASGVVIEVTDDGQGIDAEALKRKAVEKGLITPESSAAMSEEAAHQLIFLPGLTTAAKVTDVSGRGVGMDVVRSNVRNLQGSIEIRSQAERGTTLLIKLPTSLLISKGILLEAGANEYVLPLGNVRDMVKLPLGEAHEYQGQTLLRVRGTTYSVFSLARMLGLAPKPTPELSVAIVEAGTLKYGLVVDRFLTEVEVLVKPLAGDLEQCKEFQGAAIMGDGRVVLVLNALECHNLDRTLCN